MSRQKSTIPRKFKLTHYQEWEKYETGPKLGDWAATKVGEPLYVIGSPLGLDGTLTSGMVSSKREMDGFQLLQLSAAISPGSSGSPILNERGEVIGMVTSALKSGQSLNFGVSVKDMKEAFGVPLAYVYTADDAEPTPANPPMLLDPKPSSGLFASLDQLGPVNILIEDLPEVLSTAISSRDLKTWVEKCCRSAGFTVGDYSAASEAFQPAKSEIDALKKADQLFSQCYVNENALKMSDGVIVYSASVEIERGAFVFPGRFLGVTVASRSKIGYFGRSYDAGTVLKEAVSDLVSQLGKMRPTAPK